MELQRLRAALYDKGLSAKTVKDYSNAIARSQDRMRDNGWTLDDVPAPVLAAYCDTTPHSRSTRNMLRCAPTVYWDVTGREHPPVGAIGIPKVPTFQSRALSPEDASTMARAGAEWGRGGEEVAVLLALYLGLRAFEIAKLRWDEFNDDLTAVTFMGKWDVVATLPVHPLVVRRLEWWRGFTVASPADARL